MGVRLMVEMLDRAPPELTPAERLVLVAIAEDVRDGGGRTGSPGMELLCRRTGLSEEGLRRVFQRLAKRGIEIRVALGVGKKGRPIFAKPGARTTYQLPAFPDEEEGRQYSGTAKKAVPESQSEEMAVPESRTSVPESQDSGREYRPSPSSPSSPSIYRDAREDDPGLFDAPEPKPKKQPLKKKTPAPEHLDITDRMRAWAAEKVPDVDLEFETEQFLDHHRGKGNTFTDWTSAWRTWMRNSRKFAEQRQQQNRLRVVGGTRSDIPSHDFWDNITDEQKRNIL